MTAAMQEGLRAIQQKSLAEGLINLYQEQILCDTTLEAENKQIKVHKCVLIACSPYFKGMFAFESENTDKAINLQNMTGPVLQDIVTFIYSGLIDVNNDNVQALVSAANMLQIEPLLNFCIEYMSDALCVENCLDVLVFADFMCFPSLKESAQSYVLENFTNLYHTDPFCMLNLSLLSVLLKSDDLNITNEEIVFEAILRWIKHDLDTRKEHLFSLFLCIRFSLLQPDYIDKVVSRNMLVFERDACKYLLNRMQDFKGEEPSPFNKNARLGMFMKDMLIFSGGAFSFNDRAFTCVDPDTYKCYHSIKPHPSFDFKFKLDLYRLIVTPENGIYCIGGIFYNDYHFQRESGKASNAILLYDQKNKTWEPQPSMPTGKCGFAVTCFEGKIYIFGGYQHYPRDPPTDETWCYDTNLESWSECDNMPLKLALQAAVTVNDSAFLFGGKDDMGECLPIVLQYRYGTNQWSLLDSNIPAPVSEATAINYKDKIYLLGGSNRNGCIINVYLFDPERQRWNFCADFPKYRKLLSIVRAKNYIYICGGVKHVQSRAGISRRAMTVENKDLYRYDIDNDVWSKESRHRDTSDCYVCNVASVNTKYLTKSKKTVKDAK